MKKPIALMLISIMVLMLSAFSFADVDYSLEIKAPDDEIVVEDWEEPFFITVWVMADIGDELENLEVTIEDEDSDYDVTFDHAVVHEFGSTVFKYTFEAPELTPMDKFEITVVAEFEDEDIIGVEDSKDVEVLAEDDDDEEEMDDDMYPAAPAIANKLLKDAGIPNRVMNDEGEAVNLIALVAAEMHEEEPFDLEESDSLEELKDAIDDFLVDELNLLLGKSHDELSDFTNHFVDMEKNVTEPKTDKIKPQHDNDDDEDDEDDMNDDEDDDDDDDEEEARPEKNKKK